MKNSKLYALASSFAAYILEQSEEPINGIYLFGSAARGEATKNSDIDIFIDAKKNQSIVKTVETFESTTSAKIFRASGINSVIRTLIGDLNSEDFSDLRVNIAADGIILFGKGIPSEKSGRAPHLLIWFETPRKQKKKVAFLRDIYGRKENNKTYQGLLQKLGGLKAGPNTILIPIRHKAIFLDMLKKSKVKYTIKNIWL